MDKLFETYLQEEVNVTPTGFTTDEAMTAINLWLSGKRELSISRELGIEISKVKGFFEKIGEVKDMIIRLVNEEAYYAKGVEQDYDGTDSTITPVEIVYAEGATTNGVIKNIVVTEPIEAVDEIENVAGKITYNVAMPSPVTKEELIAYSLYLTARDYAISGDSVFEANSVSEVADALVNVINLFISVSKVGNTGDFDWWKSNVLK